VGSTTTAWEISGASAAVFLKTIEPYLALKRTQARVGIVWQERRASVHRDARGRILRTTPEAADFNNHAAALLRLLKEFPAGHPVGAIIDAYPEFGELLSLPLAS
jgi:hypothetical protein